MNTSIFINTGILSFVPHKNHLSIKFFLLYGSSLSFSPSGIARQKSSLSFVNIEIFESTLRKTNISTVIINNNIIIVSVRDAVVEKSNEPTLIANKNSILPLLKIASQTNDKLILPPKLLVVNKQKKKMQLVKSASLCNLIISLRIGEHDVQPLSRTSFFPSFLSLWLRNLLS